MTCLQSALQRETYSREQLRSGCPPSTNAVCLLLYGCLWPGRSGPENRGISGRRGKNMPKRGRNAHGQLGQRSEGSVVRCVGRDHLY